MLYGMDTDIDTQTGSANVRVQATTTCGCLCTVGTPSHLASERACWRLGNRMRETAERPEGRGIGPKMGSYSYSAFGEAQGARVDPAVRTVNRRTEG